MSDSKKITEILPETINVLEKGGVVGGVYKTKDDVTENQCITGPTFLSSCTLPDIQPNTKIIGVCGITDLNDSGEPGSIGLASPKLDGWFYSDFLLFHHLLEGVAPDQTWLAPTYPYTLVKKYKEYVHGDPRKPGTRRVVLDESMLHDGDISDWYRVDPKELLGRVLATIRDECQKSAKSGRPILVLIFSHGTKDTKAIEMGGYNTEKPNLLTMRKFQEAIGSKAPKAGLCLLTTACFSGGWAINPNLNITTMTAQSDWATSYSWPLSGTSRKRFCGSPFTSAIAETLLKLSIDGYQTPENDGSDRGPTYAGFVALVKNTLEKIDTRKKSTGAVEPYAIHQPMFSAQDDEWEMMYSKRTGIPLARFHEKWLMLKAAGSPQDPPGGGYRFDPGGRVFSYDEVLSTLKKAAHQYFDSKPGSHDTANDTALHGPLRGILDGSGVSKNINELGHLKSQVDYRLNQIMGTATLYKDFLGIDFPGCHEVDVDDFKVDDPNRYGKIENLISTYPLFDPPCGQGRPYYKGEHYLAQCIYSQAWSKSPKETKAKLDSLVKYRGKPIASLSCFTT